jgi:poly-gamma-glutamate system protein
VSEPFRPRLGRLANGRGALVAIGCVAACALMWLPLPLVPSGALRPAGPWPVRRAVEGLDARAATAERIMREAEADVYSARVRAGEMSESGFDPSGLIGSEMTPLVTTLGSLEAKRTATNPRWASVLTRQMSAAGIGPGDVIAAGFSGSFPGLNLAVTAAAQALGADLIAVSSVTASTWGATVPGFTWPEIECRLVESGRIRRASIAVTAGGDGDTAQDLEPEGRQLSARIRDSAARRLGVVALRPSDHGDAVRQRLSAYRRAANGRPIALYVNVGGTAASLGQSAAVLRLQSGFVRPLPFDRSESRGVMARFVEQGVRVLTLLNVRDLAVRWGVPLAGAE